MSRSVAETEYRSVARLEATLALDEPVTVIPGVKRRRACELANLGIRTVRDLLCNYPRRYIDMSRISTISASRVGQMVTIAAQVHEVKIKKPKPRLILAEVTLVDGTGTLIVTAFRQPWLKEKLHPGDKVAVSGKVEFDYGFKRMVNPNIESVEGDVEGVILPVHPATGSISAAQMRGFIRTALKITAGVFDPIPLDVRNRFRLMSRQNALRCVHFPTSMDEAREARRRLAFEEIFYLQLFMMRETSARNKGKSAFRHNVCGTRVNVLEQTVPFDLTDDQKRAVDDVFRAMAADSIAEHMVLGDVGTGKTAVAAFAMAAAADSGGQTLMLAPTEVLARQHGETICKLLSGCDMRIEVLTSATNAEDRKTIVDDLASGEIDVLIGTHALLEDDVRPKNCTLTVIDEQQRFGVEQRASLLAKGEAADALFLTATPIPRSLALTLFGNLTLSYMSQKPRAGAGRTTHIFDRSSRGEAYDLAKEAVERGEQVYVVCALIGLSGEKRDEAAGGVDENEERYHPHVAIEGSNGDPDAALVDAVNEAKYLQDSVFVGNTVDLLHGSMSAQEKHDVMERFAGGEIDVLVTTTVVEVGVDVANATVMIIEDADRFGLSQLHQLRGRVGRADKPGEVFLISASKKKPALERLEALASCDDGFKLAEKDLELRREGDILGNRQSGASTLKLVNVVRDSAMIEQAHICADALVRADPDFSSEYMRTLSRELKSVFSNERYEYAVVGG